MNLFLRQLWLSAYCTFNKILRQGVFHLRINYLYEKYYPVYAGILPWTSGIPPWGDEMKDVPAWYKPNEKFMRKWLCSSDLAIVPSRLLSRPGFHINSPLHGCSKLIFQWLIHLKNSDNLKQHLKMKQQKINFQI